MPVGAIAGGVLGFIAGLALSGLKKKKKNGASALSVCGPTKAVNWLSSTGRHAIALTTQSDLALAMPQSRGGKIPDIEFPPGDNDLILVQDTCMIFKWQGDAATGGWITDPVLTNELQAFQG